MTEPENTPAADTLGSEGRLDQLLDRFEDAWMRGGRPAIDDFLPPRSGERRQALLELACIDLQRRLMEGEAARVEDYLARYPELAANPAAVRALLKAEYVQRRREPGLDPEEFCRRFPQHEGQVRPWVEAPDPPATVAPASSQGDETPAPVTRLPTDVSSPLPAGEARPTLPARIGRYRVESLLGEGGFGRVYRAVDEELRRSVAVKVPHPSRVARPADMEAYLAEARVLAELDHPHIVPVYDVGKTDDGLCFVVSKFIEGRDLAGRIKEGPPPVAESAAIVAAVAEALHHAHLKGLVHRDVKPANILLNTTGKPFLADFGLALKEEDFGRGEAFAGTPAYMSPEQARGEGHRVDGRSDVFSLGVVLYELLAGRRPFRGHSQGELLRQIARVEPRPPRQVDDTIPAELERICLKALAKRASERYTTAGDLAADLRHFLGAAGREQEPGQASLPGVARAVPGTAVETPTDSRPAKIVPKGLRSFDGHDADFFLDLLPGPRDRDGLPESIRFWKSRIEERDADRTFSVGLIYGPSGCGKSSLVKAGLLPRLAGHVTSVYVEATAEETEARLLKGLRKQCPDLPAHLGLIDSLAALRKGQGVPAGKKVLLVLDQFEQWLHARRAEDDTELVQALRQCDGGRVQCVVLVRDDFWLAVSRFMAGLDVQLLQGHNVALVDLFDLLHARKVLAEFGRAFGRLPDDLGNLDKEQDAFLAQAVTGLSQDGKVVSVRLALFCEMVKGRPWSPATLQEVGGAAGVGVAFLEETFSASTAPPTNRLHQKAARSVLKALLPESGTDIKGNLRSRDELLAASGYAGRSRDFAELLRILDGELRLVTPSDAEGIESEAGPRQPARQFYQLTHDYLVPSLREWLSRKQKETRRGRAELRLAERSASWNARPETRYLPAWWEWANIRLFTRKKDWTPPQRKMMRTAGRFHAVRGTAILVVLLLLGWGIDEAHGRLRAESLTRSLLTAETADVPRLVGQLEGCRRWADARLLRHLEESPQDSKERLHASLALLPVDGEQVEYLCQRLLHANPAELLVIREALLGHREALARRLWAMLEDRKVDPGQRFRAACALAAFAAPEDEDGRKRWQVVAPFVADRLLAAVQQNPSSYHPLLQTLEPVRDPLVDPLSVVFYDSGRPEADRTWAASFLGVYADRTRMLTLLLDANPKQFIVLFPKAEAHRERAVAACEETLALALDKEKTEPDKERLAKRQANAGVVLLRLGQAGKVWPLLKHSPDPRVRSYLIHRLGPLGADAETLARQLDQEHDVTIRRALILSLGPEEFGEQAWTAEGKEVLIRRLQDVYQADADPGLHAAAEWLLRQWKQETWLREVDQAWTKDPERRQKRLDDVKQQLRTDGEKAKPQWYVNSQAQTMVVIPGQGEFLMGSPPAEAGRSDNEGQYRVRIGRTFALAAKAVTVAEYRLFDRNITFSEKWAPGPNFPVVGVSWFQAASYCNWLSAQDNIPEDQWCYEPTRERWVKGLKKNYLSLEGYRLATEAEWEYACRAGAVTARCYGESEELLPKYAWYVKNAEDHGWPGGGKKPNDLGLFDLHGNVWTWCQESFREYPRREDGRAIEDKEDKLVIRDGNRMMRGGSFYHHASFARCASRFWFEPSVRNFYFGFRVARTVR